MFEMMAHIQPAGANCRDRAAWVRKGNRLVIAVADGADSNPDSGFAAEFAIRNALKYVGNETAPLPAAQWQRIVSEIDEPLSLEPSGETTLVVADFGKGRCTGASVGDSVAWLINAGGLTDLTAQSKRKPLLGSTQAVATGFEGEAEGILLVASDGLSKYAARERVVAAASEMNPRALIEFARLPDGSLFDDACVVMARAGNGNLPTGAITWIET
jgi:hypothetical protein